MNLHLKIRWWDVAREKTGRKAVAVTIAIVAAVGVASWIWIRTSIDRRWTGMERRIEQLRAEWESRPSERPLLRGGESVPGNAWDDYAQALELDFGAHTGVVDAFAARSEKADVFKVVPVVRSALPAFDALQKGARRSGCRTPVEWERGMFMTRPEVGKGRLLVQLGICRARLLQEEARSGEAVDLLLDCCQFARDFGHDGAFPIDGWTPILLDRLLKELARHLTSGGTERLPEIARAMEVLEDTLSKPGESLRKSLLCWGYTFLFLREQLPETIHGIEPDWRVFYSWRLQQMDAYDVLDDLIRPAPVGRMSRAEGRQFEAKGLRIMGATRNPLAKHVVEETVSAPPFAMKALLRMRLIRIVAVWRATGDKLDLPDVGEQRIQVEERDGTLRAWSSTFKELSIEARR